MKTFEQLFVKPYGEVIDANARGDIPRDGFAVACKSRELKDKLKTVVLYGPKEEQ